MSKQNKVSLPLWLGSAALLVLLGWLWYGAQPKGGGTTAVSKGDLAEGRESENLGLEDTSASQAAMRREGAYSANERQRSERFIYLRSDPSGSGVSTLPGIYADESSTDLGPVPIPFAVFTKDEADSRVRRVLPVLGQRVLALSQEEGEQTGVDLVAALVEGLGIGDSTLHLHSIVAGSRMFRPVLGDPEAGDPVDAQLQDQLWSRATLLREVDPASNVLVFGGMGEVAAMAPTLDREVSGNWISAPDYTEAKSGFSSFGDGQANGFTYLLNHSWVETAIGVWAPASTWKTRFSGRTASPSGGRLTLSAPANVDHGVDFRCRIYELRSNRWSPFCEVQLGVGEDFLFPSFLQGEYLSRWRSYEQGRLIALAADESVKVGPGLDARSVAAFDGRLSDSTLPPLVQFTLSVRLPEGYPQPTEQMLKRCKVVRRPYPTEGFYYPLVKTLTESGLLVLNTEVDPGAYTLKVPFLGVEHNFTCTPDRNGAVMLPDVESSEVIFEVYGKTGELASEARVRLDGTPYGTSYELGEEDSIRLPHGKHAARLTLEDGTGWSTLFTVDSTTDVVAFKEPGSEGLDPGMFIDLVGLSPVAQVSSAGIAVCSLIDDGGYEYDWGASIAGLVGSTPSQAYLESSARTPAMMMFYSEVPGYLPVLARCSGSNELSQVQARFSN